MANHGQVTEKLLDRKKKKAICLEHENYLLSYDICRKKLVTTSSQSSANHRAFDYALKCPLWNQEKCGMHCTQLLPITYCKKAITFCSNKNQQINTISVFAKAVWTNRYCRTAVIYINTVNHWIVCGQSSPLARSLVIPKCWVPKDQLAVIPFSRNSSVTRTRYVGSG